MSNRHDSKAVTNIPVPPQTPSLPVPPQVSNPPNDSEDSFNSEDVSFILEQHLRPEHSEDPFTMAFITSYLACRDCKQASGEAGIQQRTGRALLKRQDIHLAIKKVTEVATLKYGLDADGIVERVKEMAFLDPADCVRFDGAAIENLRDIPPETRRAIKKMKIKNLYEKDPNGVDVLLTGKLVEFEFFDKLKATEMLGSETGNFKKTTVQEHDVSQNMKDVLLESADRAQQRMERVRGDDANARDVIDVGGSSGDTDK